MFKKINQYLITHYPLVWNLKLVWILLAGILINIISFVNGYFHFHHQSQLLENRNFDDFYSKDYFIYYFIVILLILISWLYYYIKNNRFKSKFPTSRNYLFKEFISVFAVLILFMLVPNMFKLGYTKHVASSITDEQFEKDVDLINRITPFTLQISNGYSNFSRNLSVPVFDSLVSEAETLSLYKKKKATYLKQYPNTNYTIFFHPYFRNEEFNELLFNKIISSDKIYSGIEFSKSYSEYGNNTDLLNDTYPDVNTDELYEGINSNIDNKDIYTIYSLYNFSQIKFNVPNHPNYTQKYYDEQLIIILQDNDRVKIENIIADYRKLLDKYKVGYRFNDKKWIDYIPKPPYYLVTKELQNSYYYNGVKDIPKDYVNSSSIETIYSNYHIAKYNPSIFKGFEFFITSALIITLIIITFRFSSFKVWLISQIGIGILFMFGVFFGILFSAFGLEEYIQYIISIGFYILFLVIIILGLIRNENKITTGVALNWFVYLSVFILLLVIDFYKNLKINYLVKKHKIEYYQASNYPEISAIDEFISMYFYINPILFIIAFYFIINWYRKWQAMAEE